MLRCLVSGLQNKVKVIRHQAEAEELYRNSTLVALSGEIKSDDWDHLLFTQPGLLEKAGVL